ncbi:MAG: NTP transferase domain-containing protein [Deltaproteobacteria bacterium]|nr:NTP transferase domain-containing protein [Deltaproteobacteria bacterium]
MTSSSIYAVIMAGGSGTRFWPASRRTRPKQLLPLGGGEALVREAVARVAPLCGMDHVYIATGRHLVDATAAVLPELGPEQLLAEPMARNTAPCIGWAVATIARRDPEAVVMALPSDTHIRDLEGYRQSLETAIGQARTGVITTIGIEPTHPETGFGYIEAERGDGPVLPVKRFVEKPTLERAEQFLASGNFYWNAGMFIFRARDMLAAIEAHLPDLASGLAKLDRAAAAGEEGTVLEKVFADLPAVSIDHGVMEHIDALSVVPGRFGWSDLGSWLAAGELAARDSEGNAAPDSTVLIDAQHNQVVDMRSGGAKRVVALVGVSNLVVVETDDALLVVERDASQRVGEVVQALKDRGDDDLV